MPLLRALCNFIGHKTGDEFEATEMHARILTEPSLMDGPKCEYVDRALRPDPTPSTTIEPRRRYQRRDMRAQD